MSRNDDLKTFALLVGANIVKDIFNDRDGSHERLCDARRKDAEERLRRLDEEIWNFRHEVRVSDNMRTIRNYRLDRIWEQIVRLALSARGYDEVRDTYAAIDKLYNNLHLDRGWRGSCLWERVIEDVYRLKEELAHNMYRRR